jgi:hypothetical protein
MMRLAMEVLGWGIIVLLVLVGIGSLRRRLRLLCLLWQLWKSDLSLIKKEEGDIKDSHRIPTERNDPDDFGMA